MVIDDDAYEDERESDLNERFGNTARSLQFLMQQQIKMRKNTENIIVDHIQLGAQLESLEKQLGSIKQVTEGIQAKLYHDNGASSFQTRLNTLDSDLTAVRKELQNLDTTQIQRSNNQAILLSGLLCAFIGVLGAWGAAWISTRLSAPPAKGSLDRSMAVAQLLSWHSICNSNV